MGLAVSIADNAFGEGLFFRLIHRSEIKAEHADKENHGQR